MTPVLAALTLLALADPTPAAPAVATPTVALAAPDTTLETIRTLRTEQAALEKDLADSHIGRLICDVGVTAGFLNVAVGIGMLTEAYKTPEHSTVAGWMSVLAGGAIASGSYLGSVVFFGFPESKEIRIREISQEIGVAIANAPAAPTSAP